MAGSLGDAALAYAYRGWPVFPIKPRDKMPPLTAHGFKDASTDPERIRAWWTQWPAANIGYATGALVVVEVDPPEGVATMNALRDVNDWSPTLFSMSGRPGLHWFYAAPEGETVHGSPQDGSPRSFGLGISVRATGQYVVLPPSVHPSGRRYQWVDRREPAPLPAWMLERLRKPKVYPNPINPDKVGKTAYAQAALDGECSEVASAVEGTLNDTLNRASFRLGQLVALGALSEGTVRDALLAAAMGNGHPERGATRTIESGLSAGMRAR